MNINRQKNTSIAKKEQKETSTIVFDLTILNCFCKYILSESRYVRKHHLMNLRKLIDILDLSLYENDIEKVKRIQFIKIGLDCRLEKRLSSPALIVQQEISLMSEEIDFIDLNDCQLSMDELEWVSDTVTETLNYAFIFNHIDKLQDMCTRFKATDYRYRGTIVDEFENIAGDMKNSFRKAKVDSLTDMTFSLREDKFEQTVTDTYNIVTSPSRRLLCCMQGLNDMTNGGFENGRVYMLFGMTAVGKSMTMLNIIYQIKKANTNYKTKDPTKTPCIVLLTMENSVVETITRLFAIATDGGRMIDYTIDEVLYKLRTEGELCLNDESPIDIVIKYKANRSVDTSYLYNMVDDLEDDGYEVIMLMQDHVKRIRSIFKQSDLRIELGEVVNEFKAFALEKDIPVLTDSHLNREAAKILENISQSNKNIDATKQLGKSTVGESFLMIDNLDFGAIINIDYDEQGNRHMVFSVIKRRDDGQRDYIAQPFVQGSKIKLIEDLYVPVPLFKETLHESSLYQGENGRKNVRSTSYSDISALDGMFKKEDDNIFETPIKYTDMTPLDSDINEDEEYNIYTQNPEVIGQPSQPIPVAQNAIVFFTKVEKPIIRKEALYFY